MKQLSNYQMAILYVLMNNNYLTTHQVHSMTLDVEPLDGGCLGHLNRASSNLIALKKRGYVRKVGKKKEKWSITAVGMSVVKSEAKPGKLLEQLADMQRKLKQMDHKHTLLFNKYSAVKEELENLTERLVRLERGAPVVRSVESRVNKLEGKLTELNAFTSSHVHASDTAQLIVNAKKAGAKNITIEI